MIAPGKIVTQDRDRYRVDGYLMDTSAIPPDTSVPFELEMKCFSLPAWHALPKKPSCLCADHSNGAFFCYLGNTEYDNADSNLCVDTTTPAGTGEYDNADVLPRDLELFKKCI